jgi:N-acetylglucosamine-6-sulfatase
MATAARGQTGRGRTAAVCATALAALAGLAIHTGAGSGSAVAGNAAASTQTRPNIVLVTTDDQTMGQLTQATMPRTLELLGRGGTTFTDAIATTPLCCPSRASMITGQYGHNNGILSNAGGYKHLIGKRNVLPMWLKRAGYRTAHVGRYLNTYKGNRAAPGWQRWFSMLEPRIYFDYDVQLRNGDEEHYGTGRRDYVTSVINKQAVGMVRDLVKGPKPFFLQVDHLAPHSDGVGGELGTPCERSAIPPSHAPQGFEQVQLPRPPSFDEQDVGDKPLFIQVQPNLDPDDVSELERQWRCRLASLPSVDAGVNRIYHALEAAGELDNTAIIFVSDNGFFFGEHRVVREKYHAYEEAVRIPLLIRFPVSVGGTGLTVDAPVANIDIPPTLLELAGASPCIPEGCRVMDGRSLVPLAAAGATQWGFERALLVELDRHNSGTGLTLLPCEYHGVRVDGQLYVEYDSVPNSVTGACEESNAVEHYDLASDPFELQNLYPAPQDSATRAAQQELATRLAALRDCAGIEGRDPAPPNGHYCE